MVMINHNKPIYDNSTHCHICNEELAEDRVHNHCHLLGKFRGAAHNKYNLKYRVPNFFQLSFTICLAIIARHPFITKIIEQ